MLRRHTGLAGALRRQKDSSSMNHSADIAAIEAISALPTILELVSDLTTLRFICVARVTDTSWTACAVLDKLGFGMRPGDQLDIATTLCREVHDEGRPIVIDHVSEDIQYCRHPTPQIYGFESYFSMPLHTSTGAYFGTLCGLDRVPARLSEPKTLRALELLAQMISHQLQTEQTLEQSLRTLRTEISNTAHLRSMLQQLRSAEQRQSFQLDIAELLRQQPGPDRIYAHSSEIAGRYLGVSQVLYAELDPAQQAVLCRHGYNAGAMPELGGRHAASIFPAEMLTALQEGRSWACADLARQAPAGWPELAAAVALPLGRHGSSVCFLLVCHHQPRAWGDDELQLLEDMAERVWNVIERVRTQEALRQADRRKDEFLAMLAHELRNPLAPISTAAQLLKLGRQSEERISRTSDVITRQVSHMTSLINDLLDVSRVTRGLIVLERQRVPLQQVMADAVEQVRPLIESRRHNLAMQAPTDEVLVLGDAKRLVQVLANLLSNAAKYTPEGGHLALWLEADGQEARLHVSDNGIGISAELLPHVFDLFSQAERPSDRSQGGLGLGLPLVKSLVELHAGSVRAVSRGQDCGSEFVVTLPRLGVFDATPSGRDGDHHAQAEPAALRVMVVDDNVDAAQMLGMYLENEGHEVCILHDPHEALALAERMPMDAFLLDIGLPGIDGNELASRLRALPQTRGALLVAITGYGQRFDRLRSMQAGFDHYLVKPADPAALAALLAHAGRRQGK